MMMEMIDLMNFLATLSVILSLTSTSSVILLPEDLELPFKQ